MTMQNLYLTQIHSLQSRCVCFRHHARAALSVHHDLKDEETSQGLKSEEIALDGIAVIVNKDNGVEDLSMDQIMKIFTGEITNWADVK